MNAPEAPNVLIVEDEALIAFSLEDAFKDEGYRVTGPFPSCADALASLAKTRPDLAVLDAALSDGSCLELARQLRHQGVPFLIYSGRDAFEEEAPELGDVLWLEKPAPSADVVRAAAKLLAQA
jgi:DNA-binding response OmpR family regulator